MTGSSFYYSETGLQTAQPVYLLDFAAGTTHWRYTTCAYTITYGDETYAYEPGLVVGVREISDSERRSLLEITVDWSNSLIQSLLTSPPDVPISLTMRKGHTDETAFYQKYGAGEYGSGIYGGHEWVRRFYGWLLGHNLTKNHRAVLSCSPYYTDLGLAGFCLRSGRSCQVPLGSTACSVDLSAYEASGTILTVDGDTITAAVLGLQADGYYDNGVLETSTHSRMIVSHAGTTAVLNDAIIGLAVGTAITVTPGCDHLWDGDCKTRFDNQINFRGQPHRATANVHKRGIV